MKLKGKKVKSMTKEERLRAKKTLAKMEARRNKDAITLRKQIEIKLMQLKDQKEKGLKIIEAYKKAIQDTVKQLHHITGAEQALKELIQPEE